jgi:hypothetical protein
MMELSTKRWISAINAQGSREIIVAVQVVAVKTYVAAVVPLGEKERHGEIQEPSNLMVLWVSPPPWMLMYFFAGLFRISPFV